MKERIVLVVGAVVLVGVAMLVALMLASPGQVSPADAETFSRANQLYSNGNYEAAKAMYLQLVDAGIENADVYHNLGVTYAALGDANQAETMFAKARELAPRESYAEQSGTNGLPVTQNEIALIALGLTGVIALGFVLVRTFRGGEVPSNA
jgi:tetratricopeptide (TPR) repeat protein